MRFLKKKSKDTRASNAPTNCNDRNLCPSHFHTTQSVHSCSSGQCITTQYSRLKVAFELPTNWMNMTSSSSEASNILLCCLTQHPPLQYSEVKYTTHIDQLLMWTLSVFSCNISIERYSMLACFYFTLDCVDHVIELV